ncbi:MAG: HD domain-containing protein [Planctomycetes bacterium]|nr:HD domain-containing protein [Planctomycetota bacterium]
MERIKSKELPRAQPLPWDVLHASGNLLFKRGETIDDATVEMLINCSIRFVQILDKPGDRLERVKEQLRHKEINVLGCTDRDILSQDVYSKDNRLLFRAGTALADEDKQVLFRHEVAVVWVRKSSREMRLGQVAAFRKENRRRARQAAAGAQRAGPPAALDGSGSTPASRPRSFTPDTRPTAPRLTPAPAPTPAPGRTPTPAARPALTPPPASAPRAGGAGTTTQQRLAKQTAFITRPDALSEQNVESAARGVVRTLPADANPLLKRLRSQGHSERPVAEKKAVATLYATYVKQAQEMLDTIAQGRAYDGQKAVAVATNLMRAMLFDKNLLLNIAHSGREGPFLATHTINVTLLAINIAIYMSLGEREVRDAGVCAFFHDVGMVAIPERIIMKPGPLTVEEQAFVRQHPALGLKLLGHVEELLDTVPIVVHQEHEFLDGTGYPRGLKGDDIHDFAKIVAVADYFDALASDRPYRGPNLPHHSVQGLLVGAKDRKYDPRVIQAFLRGVGLYPIGSWVRLSDDRLAKVVAALPTAYDRPVVKVYGTETARLEPPPVVDLSTDDALKVAAPAPVPAAVADDVMAFF